MMLTDVEWICDSIATTINRKRNTVVAGKGLMIEFDQTGKYTVYENEIISNNYLLSHDTVYFWEPEKQMKREKFFIIKELANRKLHLWEKDSLTGRQFDEYYHY